MTIASLLTMASEGGDLAARSQVCAGGAASGSGDPAAGSEQADAATADRTDRRASVKHLKSWECLWVRQG